MYVVKSDRHSVKRSLAASSYESNRQIYDIAILNDSTRYQALPGNADPEALPRFSQARQSLWTLIPRRLAWEPVIETDLGLL